MRGVGFGGNMFMDAFMKAQRAQQFQRELDLYTEYIRQQMSQGSERFTHERQGWDPSQPGAPQVSAAGPFLRGQEPSASVKDQDRLGVAPPQSGGSTYQRQPMFFGGGGMMSPQLLPGGRQPQAADAGQLFRWLGYLSGPAAGGGFGSGFQPSSGGGFPSPSVA